MNKINISNYNIPSEKDHKIIEKDIIQRRHKFYRGGLIWGLISFALAIIFAILYAVCQWEFTLLNCLFIFILFDSSANSFIGAFRSKKEMDLYKQKDYKIRYGIISDVKKRNSWSDSVAVQYDDGTTEIFSQIGHNFSKNNKVIVSIANQEKAKWVLPRINIVF